MEHRASRFLRRPTTVIASCSRIVADDDANDRGKWRSTGNDANIATGTLFKDINVPYAPCPATVSAFQSFRIVIHVPLLLSPF